MGGGAPMIVRRVDWPEWFSPGELGDKSFQRISGAIPGREDDLVARLVSGQQ